jgi:hypothetical protein
MRLTPFCPFITRALLMGALLSCSSPTDVDPLVASLRPVSFATVEEWLQWPSTPTVDGGEALVVRGRAFVGCGRAEARAQRWENVVGLEIRALETNRVCPAGGSPWMPFEATVTGLVPGTYRVRVRVAGIDGHTEGAATIAAP